MVDSACSSRVSETASVKSYKSILGKVYVGYIASHFNQVTFRTVTAQAARIDVLRGHGGTALRRHRAGSSHQTVRGRSR